MNKCKKCDIVFKTRGDLFDHLQRVHPHESVGIEVDDK